MSAFDDLTLGEVEELIAGPLKGKPIEDSDALMIAGGVMWLTQRKESDPGLSWDAFKEKVKMGEIKAFSMKMQQETEAETLDPSLAQPGQPN